MKLSRRVLDLAESATLAVSAKAARMRSDGLDVVSFGAGEPDFDTPSHVNRAGIAAIESGKTKYGKPASGIPAAKEAVCAKFSRDNGLGYSPDQVIITAGGKMACYLAMQAFLDPGDEAIVPVPYWVSYPEMVKLAGGVPVFVAGPEQNDYKLTPELLREKLTDRTRVVLLNSPSNPSGVTYSPDEVRALATVLTGRDLIVISDEIYDQLVFGDQKALSYAAVSDAAYAQTVTINAGSKTYSMTGWRIGYAAGPAELIKGMIKLQSQSTSGAATFTQEALAEALVGDQNVVASMRQAFEQRAEHMWKRLCAMPGVTCPRPTGAFYCFPNIAKACQKLRLAGSAEFAERLLEQALVAVVPGVAFGLDSHARLSYASDMTTIDKGLDRIEKFLLTEPGP